MGLWGWNGIHVPEDPLPWRFLEEKEASGCNGNPRTVLGVNAELSPICP